MRLLVLAWMLLATGVAAGLAACQGASPRPAGREYDAATFFATVNLRGASFSSDESRLLLSSDESGVFNVYSLPVDGGAATRLTRSTTNAQWAVGYFPLDDRVLFTADEGGNELNHLYVRETDGRIFDLTPGQGHKARFFGWAGDDRSFYVLTNERDRKAFDLYRYAADGYHRTRVFENTGGFGVARISLDGRWLALSRVHSNADNDLFLWDARRPGRAPRRITPHEGDVSFNAQTFTPDSERLYYLSDENSEFKRLWYFEMESGARGVVEEAEWDIQFVQFSRDGRYRAIGINADARTRIDVIDTKTRKPVRFPRALRGSIGRITFSRSGERLAFYVNDDTSPANLYVLEHDTGKHRRLTRTLSPAVRASDLVPSEVVRFASFDGLRIPALLYRPKSASRANPAPAIVFVHGGPGGQTRTGYRADFQFLLSHGYAILAVNNRGSSGYGKTFYHLDDRRHGEDDLKDCVYARRYLETLDWVDASRVGIMGGSYGGYLVVAALAFEPDAFDVGIDIFGVTNWVRTLESVPPWWAAFRNSLVAELGDPQADRARLRRISPLFHAENIRKPLLVVQGANDPRVLKVESDELVEAVRRNGVPVQYIVFDDEGHGFRRKENRIAAAEAYLRFLDRYLR